MKLKNYRNYLDLTVELSDKLNIFIGDNAQGKSNLLESIVVLALTKSYLGVKDKNLINLDNHVASVYGTIVQGSNIDNLFVSFNSDTKKIKINDVELKKYSDYISKVKFILFSPQDVNFIRSTPSFRRKSFNVILSQISSDYVKLLQNYNYILKKRNQFLKKYNDSPASKMYLANINKIFVKLAVKIIVIRSKFICDINKSLSIIFKKISEDGYLELVYKSNVDLISDDIFEMEDYFLSKLNENFDNERFYGATLLGPHRDDYLFFLDNKNLFLYGSQGQCRLAVLSMKLSEIEIIKKETGVSPILLLDDIFSELDVVKRNKLIDYIIDDIQTIITTTDLNMIDSRLISRAKIFKIVEGSVIIENEKEGIK